MADPALVEQLYDIVVGDMQPVVLGKLDQLSAKEMELSRLNEAFCTSMALYEQMQRDGALALGGQQVCDRGGADPFAVTIFFER